MPNNLIHSDSPYLLQHANNPVNWYPWGEEALQKAKLENKPIFLSIGYSSCHWCHVMEKESFEDKDIADILNQHFVSIKVDKEERPDIDKHFQEVYALMNRRGGGWPTSIFLTPELKPFYTATYLPPVPKYGMMSFRELLELISQKFAKEADLLCSKGEEILSFLNQNKTKIEATKLDKSITTRFITQAKQLFDNTNGGFGSAPKFPQVSTYQTLLALDSLNSDISILSMVTTSLDSMARGGLYDRVDGGFCRYSTDEAWVVPHFEKMGYDNALLCELYLDAYQTTKKPHYLAIAQKSIDFVIQKMSQDGLFFAASDADTKEIEGEYFVFTKHEIQNAWMEASIPKKDIDILYDALSVTQHGNFEGKNIISAKNSSTVELLAYYAKAIDALKDLRKTRQYPFVDKKIITSWNAMMIKALFKATKISPHYLAIAQKCLDSLLDTLYLEGQLYHATLISKKPKIEAFLEDYAYLAQALLEGYQATHKRSYLTLAVTLANEAIKRYYKNKKWYFSQGDFITDADIYDSSYPSSMAIILEVLISLHTLREQEYLHIVFDSLQRVSYDVMRQPISSPTLTRVIAQFLYGVFLLKGPQNALHPYPMLDQIDYPFLLTQEIKEDKWILCDSTSCFVETKEIDEIIKYLQKV